jgi:hypothetical protein
VFPLFVLCSPAIHTPWACGVVAEAYTDLSVSLRELQEPVLPLCANDEEISQTLSPAAFATIW